MPDLPKLDAMPMQEAKATAEQRPECPTVAMPAAIPKNVEIVIKNGVPIKTDAGGEQLIRSYAVVRKDIKKTWQARASP